MHHYFICIVSFNLHKKHHKMAKEMVKTMVKSSAATVRNIALLFLRHLTLSTFLSLPFYQSWRAFNLRDVFKHNKIFQNLNPVFLFPSEAEFCFTHPITDT